MVLNNIFEIKKSAVNKMIRDFQADMKNGLNGKRSPLKMIPTYVSKAAGSEKGDFLAVDLGGTNFRVLILRLEGGGKMKLRHAAKYSLKEKHTKGSAETLFGFIADAVKRSVKESGINCGENIPLGFTFSFPVDQSAVNSGKLLKWTKGFKASGVVGRDVIELLNESLKDRGLGRIKAEALVNDTVGTLVALSYRERLCDVGLILGTGTNACYIENMKKIGKLRGGRSLDTMIINIEWGNFDKLPATRYDKALDKMSHYPGEQRLEKMVSGMYLGELARLVLLDSVDKKKLAQSGGLKLLKKHGSFNTEYMSAVESDLTHDHSNSRKILASAGFKADNDDIEAMKRVFKLISDRAALICAAAIAAVITKNDPGPSRRHKIAVDGTVYEKYYGFKDKIMYNLKKILGRNSSKVELALTKDGSGIGAAIIAAVAVSGK